MADSILNSEEGEARELARGLRRHDPDLLDRLIEQYQRRLFRYLLFLTGRRDVAEDLFQETWIRVLEKGHLYDGRRKFESWLFTVARNLFVDLVRRRKASISLEEFAETEGDAEACELRAGAVAPLEKLAREQENDCVAAALGRIPTVCREVLVLRFHEEMALEEIAAVTAAPLSTVKSRLYRGLDLLRGHLEEGTS